MISMRKRRDWTMLMMVVIGVLCAAVCSAQETPQEVLERWRAGQKALERMVWRAEVRGQQREPIEAPATYSGVVNEFRVDGERFDLLVWGYSKLEPPDAEMVSPEGQHSRRMIWDGQRFYFIDRKSRLGRGAQSGYISVDVKADKPVFCGMPLLGLFEGDTQSLDTILADAETLTLRQAQSQTGGSLCYVVDAKTSSGRYSVWFDPTQGYQIVRAEVRKTDDDLYGGRPLNKYRSQAHAAAGAGLPPGVSLPPNSLPEFVSYRFDLISATYAEREGVWLPMTCQYETVVEDEAHKSWRQVLLKTLNVDLEPGFAAMDAFEPNVPDGTTALLSTGMTTYTWKGGKMVDSYGFEVDPEHLGPPSLVGKPLPSLAAFDVGPDVESVQGWRLLVCFWSMNQRPSRTCVQTLNARAQTLADRNVGVVLVHAEPIGAEALATWLEQNQIESPVGTNRGDMPALSHTWGVKSLPWLILTDADHEVVAEGFGVDELEAKIEGMIDAKP